MGAEEPESAKQYRLTNDPLLLSCAVAAALLMSAALKVQADGYYTFLRIYICGLALVLAGHFWRKNRAAWMIAAVLVAVLFNPVLKVELDTGNWQWFDLAAGLGFIWLAMTGPARHLGRPWLRAVAVAVAVGGALAYAVMGEAPMADNTMNVDENLAAENIVAYDSMNVDENLAAENIVADDIVAEPTPTLESVVNSLGATPARPPSAGATAPSGNEGPSVNTPTEQNAKTDDGDG